MHFGASVICPPATIRALWLAAEIFHLDVKHHVAVDLLVHILGNLILISDLEGNSNILHLLGDSISPKSVPILPIQLQSLLNSLG
jgi:hypothetical protein